MKLLTILKKEIFFCPPPPPPKKKKRKEKKTCLNEGGGGGGEIGVGKSADPLKLMAESIDPLNKSTKSKSANCLPR